MEKEIIYKLFQGILKDSRLTPTDKLVASFIYTLEYSNKPCYADNLYIADKLRLSGSELRNALNNLEEHLLISDERGEQQNRIVACNRYIARPRYFLLSSELLDSGLDLRAIFIYSYLRSLTNSNIHILPKELKIAKMVGLTRQEVKDGLVALENAHLLAPKRKCIKTFRVWDS